jgi:hypothetical protein
VTGYTCPCNADRRYPLAPDKSLQDGNNVVSREKTASRINKAGILLTALNALGKFTCLSMQTDGPYSRTKKTIQKWKNRCADSE